MQDYSFVGHIEAISCGLGPIKGTDVAFDGPSARVIAVENGSLSLFFSLSLYASVPKSSCPGKLLIKSTLTRLHTAQKQTSQILWPL